MGVNSMMRKAMRWPYRRRLAIAGLIVAAGLLLHRLASLPAGGRLSDPEAQLAASGGNWHQLLNDPMFLPYRILGWLSRQLLSSHAVLALRLPSVIVALLALAATMYILRRWYGPRTAVFGFVMVAGSAAFLHVGRLATTDIAYYCVIPLLLWSYLQLQQKPDRRALVFWLGSLAGLLYVPGVIWLIVLQIVWQRQDIGSAFARVGNWAWRLAVVAGMALVVTPLIYGLVSQSSLGYVVGWLGLPASLPSALILCKNLAAAVAFVFIRTPENPSLWLGTLPLLGALGVVCLVAGVLFYAGHPKAERTRLLLCLTVVCLVLLTLGGPVTRSILVPLVYIVVLGGLAYLLQFWLKMFPVNRPARWLGIGVVCLVVGLSTTYNLRQYFIAWPHNVATKAAFTHNAPH